MLQPAGVEDHREVLVGQFSRLEVRAGVEHRTPRRGRERQPRDAADCVDVEVLRHTVVDIADRVDLGGVLRRARPLHRRIPEPLVADPAQVITGARIVEAADLVEDLLTGFVVERVAEPEVTGDPADQLPVRPRVPGRQQRLLQQREGAIGVHHHRVGLGPQRGGQHDVGVPVGGGVGVRVLGDHQFGGAQPGDDGVPIRHAGNRVGADHPCRLDVCATHAAEHLDGSRADVGADGAGFEVPLRFDERTVIGRGHRALAGQTGSHVAHLASAHRVGLPGQRHRAAAGAADRAGGQVQVADRVGVPGAVGALVQAHGPTGHPVAGRGDHARRTADVGLVQPGDLGDAPGRVVGEERRHRVPALGVLGDEIAVDRVVFDE